VMAFGVASLVRFGQVAEGWFRADPALLVRRASAIVAAGVSLLGLAVVVPVFAVMAVLYAAAVMLLLVSGPALTAATQAIIPDRMRPHAAALSGIFLAGVGGFAGLLYISGL